jgi:hypothetical protein
MFGAIGDAIGGAISGGVSGLLGGGGSGGGSSSQAALDQLASTFKDAQDTALQTQELTTRENSTLAVFKKQVNS